ncbi:hypothetical protein F383_26711 [Gossypium arboreum]|uniref:Uncharacterized protein n=1 Tax=Gossypium arboreum TaxID=29729 RepID=A0A0B0PBI6_GOSAR|nr:hypothetical protein F383_26711 [Gossypium arboreum]
MLYVHMWFVTVFGYGIYVFYDAYMLKMISLFVYDLLSLLCMCLHCVLDIEATGGSGIVEDHHHTIKLNFGTF